MKSVHQIDLGFPALLEFRGPDTVRFLNGQLTQDVRRVAGGTLALPSCVTDAKGRLQFRIWITEGMNGGILVEGPAGSAETLEARLTRYLIADDVEVCQLTGKWALVHFTGAIAETPPEGVMVRDSVRFGQPGTDWWIPAGLNVDFPEEILQLEGDALEAFRVEHGVPAWGKDLYEGLLPPEAGLEATDISYQKGCYIGQEVISRIKSAGKVNKRLERLILDASVPLDFKNLIDEEGRSVGELTSISPREMNGKRHALGYVKRGVVEIFVSSPDGTRHSAAQRFSA
jgi:folate-binding protein YgfZ